jgi:hypothetical protein
LFRVVVPDGEFNVMALMGKVPEQAPRSLQQLSAAMFLDSSVMVVEYECEWMRSSWSFKGALTVTPALDGDETDTTMRPLAVPN